MSHAPTAEMPSRLPRYSYSSAIGNGAPPTAASSHGWKFWVGVTLLSVILLIGVGVGSFLVGRGTRPSNAEVAHRLSVSAARQKTFYDSRQAAALAAQSKQLTAQAKKRAAKAEQTGYASGQSAGYASGQAQGFSSGNSQGKAQGKKTGKRIGRAQGAFQGYLQGYSDGACTDPSTGAYVC